MSRVPSPPGSTVDGGSPARTTMRTIESDAARTTACTPEPDAGPQGSRWASLAAPTAVVVTVILWASSFVIVRWAAPIFSPGPLALIRLVAGVAMLTLLVLLLRRSLPPLPPLRVVLLIALYGVLWFAGYTVLLNQTGHHLDAGTAAMVVNLSPILVAVAAGVLFQEGWPRSLFLGMAVALLGIGVITAAAGGGQVSLVGVVLALIAAVTYAAGMLLQRTVLPHAEPLTVVWLGCLAGTLAVLPWAPQAWHELQSAPPAATFSAVFMGVGATALGFWLWAFAQTQMHTGRLAACSLSVPAVAILMSAAALREIPTPLAMIGGALCLAGVAVTQFGRR